MKDDFCLVLKLEISYRVIISLEGFWFLLEDFFFNYIFAWGLAKSLTRGMSQIWLEIKPAK